MSHLKLPWKRLIHSSYITRLQPRFQSTQSTTQSRIDKILSRLPKPLRPYVSGLRNAPLSHVASFLVLHELTAVIPLFGLAGLFHYTEWLPRTFVEGRWVTEGVEKFGGYFGRKGWFGVERVQDGLGSVAGDLDGVDMPKEDRHSSEVIMEGKRNWIAGEAGRTILVEVATAYAITKVLLPVRILFSVWATPWFARAVLGPIRQAVKRKRAKATPNQDKKMF